MPQCYQNDGTQERFDDWYAIDDAIAVNSEVDHVCEQPDTSECCDDRTDEAERKPPTNNELCDQADDGCDDEVNDKLGGDGNGGKMTGHRTQDEHESLLFRLLFEKIAVSLLTLHEYCRAVKRHFPGLDFWR